MKPIIYWKARLIDCRIARRAIVRDHGEAIKKVDSDIEECQEKINEFEKQHLIERTEL